MSNDRPLADRVIEGPLTRSDYELEANRLQVEHDKKLPHPDYECRCHLCRVTIPLLWRASLTIEDYENLLEIASMASEFMDKVLIASEKESKPS